MSIQSEIAKLQAGGKLFPYVPVSVKPIKRRLYLTEQARNDFEDENSAVRLLVTRGPLAAAMTRWVLGQLVYLDYLKRLDGPPSDVWEIRVTQPVVQARIFCRFAAPDTLIATSMHTRGYLGSRGSAGWARAVNKCVMSWDEILPGHQALTGTTIGHFVTENHNDFDV